MNEEIIDETTKKQGRGIGNPAWVPGMESPNPEGRPKGRKNFDTIFELAIRRIVEEKKIPIGDPEMDMVIKAVIEALKGNYAYFRDIMDRRYGKAPQPLVGGDENWQPIQIVFKKDDTIPPETTESV